MWLKQRLVQFIAMQQKKKMKRKDTVGHWFALLQDWQLPPVSLSVLTIKQDLLCLQQVGVDLVEAIF